MYMILANRLFAEANSQPLESLRRAHAHNDDLLIETAEPARWEKLQ